jgi:hypothetical protein
MTVSPDVATMPEGAFYGQDGRRVGDEGRQAIADFCVWKRKSD